MESPRAINILTSVDWLKVVESLTDYLLVVGGQGQILYINRAANQEIRAQTMSRTVFDFVAPEFHCQLREKLALLFENGCNDQIEVKRSDPDFAQQWWSISLSPLRERDSIVAAIFLCRDVTNLQNIRQEQQKSIQILKEKFWKETSALNSARDFLSEQIEVRREAEKSLRDSEERYRVLIENARNAIFAIDHEGRFQFLNPVAARELGGTASELIGKTMQELFPPEIAGRQLASVQRVISTKTGESHQALTYIGGKHKWFITSIQPIINNDGSCRTALLESTDIDEQVRAGQQLARERNFSNSILQTANSLIVCLDSKANITVFNSECETVTGYTFEEVRGKSWPETFLPAEKRHAGLNDFAAWVREHPHDRYEGPLLTKSGELRTIFWSNSSFVLEDTGELMAIAIGTDITELKRVKELLEVTEARNRAVLEGLPDLVFVIDRSGVFRKYEGGHRDSLLMPAESIVGSHVSDALPPDIAENSLRLIDEAITTGVIQQCEYEIATDQGPGVFECRFVRYSDEECIAIVRDVTERRKMERDLEEINEKLKDEHEALLAKNTTLRIVLSEIQEEVEAVKRQVHANVEKLILPIISRFRDRASAEGRGYADRIEALVTEISSPFSRNLQRASANLTPREVEICSMIKNDVQSKEIAEALSLSIRTVEKFRQRIRKKLGIANTDNNLATYLKSLSE